MRSVVVVVATHIFLRHKAGKRVQSKIGAPSIENHMRKAPYITRAARCDSTSPYITLHYITLHYMTVHYMTLHDITWHYMTLHDVTLHYITLHYMTLHDTTWHYMTLHYIALHYITLHYIPWRRGRDEDPKHLDFHETNAFLGAPAVGFFFLKRKTF